MIKIAGAISTLPGPKLASGTNLRYDGEDAYCGYFENLAFVDTKVKHLRGLQRERDD